ncbi:MAG: acetyl-CoA carboxylase, carboxyltransferase subunit beta [Christensenellales bacterium]|jgi:acetyl-CoA carboxylase carboxyl transferase subunit beta
MGLFNNSFSAKKRLVSITNVTIGPGDARESRPAAHEELREGMWERCKGCSAILYSEDLSESLNVCPRCQYHARLGVRQRIGYTVDEGSFGEIDAALIGKNPLDFPGYEEKLRATRAFAGENEAMVCGRCEIAGNSCVLCVMDAHFMMGSMGAAVGEKFARAAEYALEHKLPLVAFTASGGARMQEGLVSLMQMSKTAAVLAKMDEAALLYIVVLTDPTTGGVTASFASLGDIILAEPKALIGFAGRRVIEQTVKQVLPLNFQKAEFMQEKGFIDSIVERKKMRGVLGRILAMHRKEAGV